MARSRISPAKIAQGSHSRSGIAVTGCAGAYVPYLTSILLGLRVPVRTSHSPIAKRVWLSTPKGRIQWRDRAGLTPASCFATDYSIGNGIKRCQLHAIA